MKNSKVKVGLVQINGGFSGQSYLPYALGCMQAYAERFLQRPEAYEFMLPIYSRLKVPEAVERLEDADLVLFSCYVWNERLTLAIAEELKKRKPAILNVFGGPQVPEHIEPYLKQHSFIDIASHKEGERVCLSLLENYESRSWQNVPSICYRNNGSFVHNPRIQRMNNDDLAQSPSPYLVDTFKPLMEENPHEHWIGTLETNRGCPFSCSFCDWFAIHDKVYRFELESVYKQLEWFGQHEVAFVFCADANFGILPRDVDIARHAVETKERYGYPQKLSAQGTKNATERFYQTQSILGNAEMSKVVLALQSVDDETLTEIERGNIPKEFYRELQYRFRRDGVDTVTDVILGLPKETYESFVNGISMIIDWGQHDRINFNILVLLPNSPVVRDPANREKYGFVTVHNKVVYEHARKEEQEDLEVQEMVVATKSMPADDWVRARAFAWTAGVLYFDKLLQLPLTLMNKLCGISYHNLLEHLISVSEEEFPVLASIQTFFREKARAIQKGDVEFCHASEWLDAYWPANEMMLINLCTKGQLSAFYEEAERVLTVLIEQHSENPATEPAMSSVLLHESIVLNRALLKLPEQTEDYEITTPFNIWEFYRGILAGVDVQLQQSQSTYRIDRTTKTYGSWEEWCREVVWYCARVGSYLNRIEHV